MLSLAVFYKPVYDLLFFQNKMTGLHLEVGMRYPYSTNTNCAGFYISLSSIPNLFLFANLLAVPLSSLIIFVRDPSYAWPAYYRSLQPG